MLRSVAFQHKQRALREALVIGEQVARRKRQELVAATFMAWHVQVRDVHSHAESRLQLAVQSAYLNCDLTNLGTCGSR